MFPDDDDGIRYGTTLGEKLARRPVAEEIVHAKRKRQIVRFIRGIGLLLALIGVLGLFVRFGLLPGLIGPYGQRSAIPTAAAAASVLHLPWGR